MSYDSESKALHPLYLTSITNENGSFWLSDSYGFYSTLDLQNAIRKVRRTVCKYCDNELRNATIKIYKCDPTKDPFDRMKIVHVTRVRDAKIVFEEEV